MESSSERAAGPVEARIRDVLQHIETCEPEVRAFVDRDPGGALERARTLDRLEPGAHGVLHGVPVAVKEIFDVRGLRCPAGSAIHARRVPAGDASVVTALRSAGAVILGTTVSTEFAIGAAGPTRNPLDLSRTPGGSSSGSAAAVAAGMADLALGSQTVGSTIRPAAYCGVPGFKPSYGLIPVGTGMYPLSPLLDHVGLIARDLDLVRRALVALCGPGVPVEAPLVGVVRVGPWFPEPVAAVVEAALDAAFEVFSGTGLACRHTSLPQDVRAEAEAAHVLLVHGMHENLGASVDAADPRLSAEVRALLEQGRALRPEDVDRALVQREGLTRALHALLWPGEVFLAPATLDLPPPLGEGTGSRVPQRLWTLCGMPALAVPVLWRDGLAAAVQLVGRRGEDAAVLAAGDALRKALD